MRSFGGHCDDVSVCKHIPYCQLYDEEGITRIGCVGCPLASSSKILAEFKRWPQFEKAYLWAFEKMLEGRSFDKWKTKFDVMDWYIYGAEEDCREVAAEGQISLFEHDYFDQLRVDFNWPGIGSLEICFGSPRTATLRFAPELPQESRSEAHKSPER